MFAFSPARQTLLLFLLALAALIPGIWEATGLTGKDEFFLGLRTPMEMIEGQHWLVPFLDGAPRIRKPPMLYWTGRASFEIFGISLVSARIVGVLAAALLIISAAGIARRLSGKAEAGWIAGCILLGCLGIATEGRRFMLDMPVAALSSAAFWSFLVWLNSRRFYQLTVTTLLLAAGFLTKGPIVALVFGGGCLALWLSGHQRIADLARSWKALLAHCLLWALLALPWFFVVRALYPEATNLVLADELESRQFFNLSPGILLGLLNVALPWVFVFALAAWQQRKETGPKRFVLLWFLATFLPFLFIKSFDRYLIGSLVPMAIFIAITLSQIEVRWPYRLGMALALALGGALAGFAFWFQLGGWYWLILPALYLSWAWWQERALAHTLAAPAIFWISLLAGVFPALGINAVPAAIIELGRSQSVAMFDGPQPAMLPILTGQAHRHYSKLDKFDLSELAASKTPVFVEEKDISRFKTALTASNHQANQLGSYQTLASHGSGLRFARVGATEEDWKAAFASRSLAALLTTVYWFEISQP
jgi:4-amino-4-deoxy-L-arabinose transferase-like glycosyltransferase